MANLKKVIRVNQDKYKEIVENTSTISIDPPTFEDNSIYQVEDYDVLLWKNPSPFNNPSTSTNYGFKQNCKTFKYIVFIFGATTSQNDGAFVFKFLNPHYPNNVVTGKRMYFSFVNDSGYTWERYADVYENYFTVNTGTHYTTSGSYNSSNAECTPLEVWGTNNL